MLDWQMPYQTLPDRLYQSAMPEPLASPQLIAFNRPLAEELGMGALPEPVRLAVFSGNDLESVACQPIAQSYAGHQFGNFVPRLGDGRAILLGSVRDHSHKRQEIQLKGSGRTAYSRGGDGRLQLGPALREYLVSEAMFYLGVPTTRALALVKGAEPVIRAEVQPAAILTRVASGFIRVGSFEQLAYRNDTPGLQALADYLITQYYPEINHQTGSQRYLALYARVIDKQAALVAQWMALGFVHGVMNTDNTSLLGETIDYGPCAFLEEYNAEKVFSSVDRGGRYRFGHQPGLAQWNLARFGECLLPLVDKNHKQAIALIRTHLDTFNAAYQRYYQYRMRGKLGLGNALPEDDRLIQSLLAVMQQERADFTLTFRFLADCIANPDEQALALATKQWLGLFANSKSADDWLHRWRDRLEKQPQTQASVAAQMRTVNPLYVPRNHLIEQVIRQAVEQNDFQLFYQLAAVWQQPFTEQAQRNAFAQPAQPHERIERTFCGT